MLMPATMDANAAAYIAALDDPIILRDANNPERDADKFALYEVAHIGGPEPLWIGTQTPSAPADTGGSEPVFICFYTRNTAYEGLAQRLRLSLEKYGLDYKIVAVDTMGSWEHNCAYKARFVREQWGELGRPVVWLDADATVESDPVLLRRCGADFAVSKTHGWEFGSGTVFFGATPAAGRLLDRWVLRCEADPLLWDQMHLDAAWADIASEEALITQWLPKSYLYIFDHERDVAPVITHWQASRTEKAVVSGGIVRPKPHIPFDLQVARRFSRYERSPEALFWAEEGVAHIKPEIGMEHPEGFDVPAAMRILAGDRLPVVEIGCGVGRLAPGFAPSEYIGADINPHALLVARNAVPTHNFRLITEELEYPRGGTVLFYTVMLHVSDDKFLETLKKATDAADRVIIAEIMDSRWRRGGNPPVFNRETEDYIFSMQLFGFRLASHLRVPYARYDTPEWWNRRDTRLAMLVFDRAD